MAFFHPRDHAPPDCRINILAVKALWIVDGHDFGQVPVSQGKAGKGIGSLPSLKSLPVPEVVNVYSQDTLSVVPSLTDLILYPASLGSMCADQDNKTRLPVHLPVNPSLDSGIAAPTQLLPVVVGERRIMFRQVHISHLGCPPGIFLEVETVEDPAPRNVGLFSHGE